MPDMTHQNNNISQRKRLNDMLRVDHAGENGAVRIYDGQKLVLEAAGLTEAAARVGHMAEQEQHHLTTFDRLLSENAVRPTVLSPLWNAAGFSLGVVTALMGEKAAMACTEIVEEVIDDHYAEQLAELEGHPEFQELTDTIRSFREDEAAHRQTAIEHGATEASAYPILRRVIRAGCHAAIKISEKI